MRRLFSVLFTLASLLNAYAIENDYIYSDFEMKDGSVYTGFISHQSFAKKTVTISAVSALKVLPSSNATVDIQSEKTVFSKLPEETRSWFTKHPGVLIAGVGNSDKITLADIKDKQYNRTYYNAVLLEKGDSVKFFSGQVEEAIFNSSDVVAINKSLRPSNILSGVNEKVSTKNYDTNLEGQVVRQEMGGKVYVYSTLGYLETVRSADVLSRTETLINEEQDFLKQIPFLETIITETESYSGFITQQVFGDKEKPGFLVVRTDNTNLERIEYGKITEIRRRKNEEYSPQKIREVGNDEFIVCDSIVPSNMKLDVSVEGSKCLIDENIDSMNMVFRIRNISIKDGLVVELKSNSRNRNLVLVPIVKNENLFKVTYRFNLNDEIFAAETSTDQGIDKFIYRNIVTSQYYGIYQKDLRKVIVVKVN